MRFSIKVLRGKSWLIHRQRLLSPRGEAFTCHLLYCKNLKCFSLPFSKILPKKDQIGNVYYFNFDRVQEALLRYSEIESYVALAESKLRKSNFVVFTPGLKSSKQGWLPFEHTSRQCQFFQEEFHYLNVARIGVFTLHNLFDCTFKCLRNALCLSINVAASKGANEKLWCELLSSDKYRDAESYNENMSSHHLSIQVQQNSF